VGGNPMVNAFIELRLKGSKEGGEPRWKGRKKKNRGTNWPNKAKKFGQYHGEDVGDENRPGLGRRSSFTKCWQMVDSTIKFSDMRVDHGWRKFTRIKKAGTGKHIVKK